MCLVLNQMNTMRLLTARCNLGTLADGRGAIFNFLPQDVSQTIKEWNLIQTNKGDFRGFHYHKEFNEYVLITAGQVVYFEYVERSIQVRRVTNGYSQYPFLLMGPGDCVHFPKNTPHTMIALTDVSAVALLDKRWDDCKEPLTRIEFEPLQMEHIILKEKNVPIDIAK